MASRSDETPKISLAAMTGISQPQTLKLKEHIKNENVTVLVDTGSTHNFLDIRVLFKNKHPCNLGSGVTNVLLKLAEN